MKHRFLFLKKIIESLNNITNFYSEEFRMLRISDIFKLQTNLNNKFNITNLDKIIDVIIFKLVDIINKYYTKDIKIAEYIKYEPIIVLNRRIFKYLSVRKGYVINMFNISNNILVVHNNDFKIFIFDDFSHEFNLIDKENLNLEQLFNVLKSLITINLDTIELFFGKENIEKYSWDNTGYLNIDTIYKVSYNNLIVGYIIETHENDEDFYRYYYKILNEYIFIEYFKEIQNNILELSNEINNMIKLKFD